MLRQAAMAKDRQDIVLQRRKPTQARARATMDMIFEATARIIERDGIAALNTNRIAERAGVSIGTLYEYFPNKDAILIAMARQRLADDERLVRQALSGPEADQDMSVARKAIHALVALHEDRPKVRRAIMAVHLAPRLFGCLRLTRSHSARRRLGSIAPTTESEISSCKAKMSSASRS